MQLAENLYPSMADEQRAALLASAEAFCNAFAAKSSLDVILSNFSQRYAITVHEHGLSQLAPFLGRTFENIDGAKEYFGLLSKYLSYENMQFKTYIVDVSTNRVSVRGEARFTWTSTDQSWNEVFTYQLAFDEDGKVVSYDIWADSGAAYLASKGLLESGK